MIQKTLRTFVLRTSTQSTTTPTTRTSLFGAASAVSSGTLLVPRRHFGSRGSRGHGWFIKYREGRGGRHLQGEYHDRESLEECQAWNDSILALGSTRVYMDVVVEPKRAPSLAAASQSKQSQSDEDSDEALSYNQKKLSDINYPGIYNVPPLDSLTKMDSVQRLELDMATAIMPETCHNFAMLCDDEYKGTVLYRFEKMVGLCGGDILTNTGKTGRSHISNLLTINVKDEPLVMWHLPGTVSMIVSSVEEIDSRFFFCTEPSPHLDGIHRAFARLTPESLAIVQEWQKNILTQGGGIPTTYDMIVVDAGVVSKNENKSSPADNSSASQETAASASA